MNKVIIGLLFLVATSDAFTAEVRLAVASNFNEAIHAVAEAFQQHSSHEVLISSASTGKLYAQIKQGAPFDVFLSADTKTAKKLISEHLAEAESLFVYAEGQLVLLSNLSAEPSCDAILSGDDLKHVAIANPNTAPYGLAAQETLQHMGLWDAIKPKLVRGENISQTMHFVVTRNAGVGFVAKSLLVKRGIAEDQCVWEIPNDLYAPINQALVKLKQATVEPAVDEFIAFLQTPEAIKIIDAYGYKTSQ